MTHFQRSVREPYQHSSDKFSWNFFICMLHFSTILRNASRLACLTLPNHKFHYKRPQILLAIARLVPLRSPLIACNGRLPSSYFIVTFIINNIKIPEAYYEIPPRHLSDVDSHSYLPYCTLFRMYLYKG